MDRKIKKEGKVLPKNAKIINTDIGIYGADFEYDDYLIEIKSSFTYRIFEKEILGLDKKYSTQKDRILKACKTKPIKLIVLDKNINVIKEILFK